MTVRLGWTDCHILFSGFSTVCHCACLWPTTLTLGYINNFDMLFLVMEFISLAYEMKFMLISSRRFYIIYFIQANKFLSYSILPIFKPSIPVPFLPSPLPPLPAPSHSVSSRTGVIDLNLYFQIIKYLSCLLQYSRLCQKQVCIHMAGLRGISSS